MFSHKINNTDETYHCQISYMSCIIVTLQVPVYCVRNNASIRLYQPNFKMHDVHVLRLTVMVIFSYTVLYWKRVVPNAIIQRKFSASKLNSPSRLSTNYRNTAFEVRVIVTSTWRNRFMAAWKLLKHLSHATGTRISVYTARNRLRGARLIFELWHLNLNTDPFV